MRVLLAHPGTQHAFRLARELDTRGLLGEFWTGLALKERTAAAWLAAQARGWPLIGGLNSRIAEGVNSKRVHSLPWNEVHALWRLRRGAESQLVLHERNRVFQDSIPDKSLRNADVVVGFDTSSWRLADRAHRQDRPLVLDRSIAHPAFIERGLAEVHREYPAWAAATSPRPDYLTKAEQAEHEQARRIVVGSSFARQTLVEAGAEPAKVTVNAYGVDWTRFNAPQLSGPASTSQSRPVRFLFVGSLIARKGVPVLLEAWRRLTPVDAELWLVGPCGARERSLIPNLPGLRVLGRIPHADLPDTYATADVLVQPSIVEGFSLVVLEALASGLAVIATPNTGAADVIRVPELGTIVPALSVDALEAALRNYIARPPDRTQVRAAAQPITVTHSWAAYGDRWAELLAGID